MTIIAAILFSCHGFAAEPAPHFTFQTITGRTLTSDSLKGNVVLLQFWTTWCPYCRRDQPILDKVQAEFASQGLVVVAVNVRESQETVRDYLERSPRAVHVVMDPDLNIASTFSARGYPYYILIGRDGMIAGVHGGFAGRSGFTALLERVGMTMPAEEVREERPRASAQPSVPRSPKIVEIPRSNNAPSQPRLPTIFVLANGERIEAMEYVLSTNGLQIVVAGQRRSFPLSAIDLAASVKLNHARGIELKVPTNPNEVTL